MPGWKVKKPRLFLQQVPLPGLVRPPTQRRALPTPTEQALDCARTRLVFLSLLFVVAFLVIGGRLADLTVFHAGDPGSVRKTAAAGMGRADIVDRNGFVLATSLPTISTCAQVKMIDDPETTATKIGAILPELDTDKLLTDLSARRGCVPVKRHLTPKQYYALNKLGLVGVEFTQDERRMYPQGTLAAHVVGMTDIDNIGTAGIEKKFDARLSQDALPLQLTLDIRVQHILRRELADAIKEFRAIGGAGIIMDATTGAVIAMTSLPDFDPHNGGDAADTAKFNRATLGVYELGSTFKIFTAAQALETGEVKMTDTFNTVDPIQIGHQSIRDYHPERRWLTLPEIIMVSSNIGAAHIAAKIGGPRQRSFLDRLGMFTPTPIELPEVGRPIVPDNWGDATTMTVGFGHGIAVSPLQLTRSMAAMVNGGRVVTPTLLLTGSQTSTPATTPIVSDATTAKVRAMMRLVVAAGTAKSANVAGYIVGGKTGTSEKIGAHGYNKDARLSSFIGAFPLHTPHYVIFAMLDEPKGTKKTWGFATGGWVAAPLAGRVITAAAPLLGLPPQEPDNIALIDRQILKPIGAKLFRELIERHETTTVSSIQSVGEH
ncbi:MAG: penicillin-binding protein 2 [Alphaproteobacteria bacterium]